MADDKPREFPVEVTLNGVKVTVTLMSKPSKSRVQQQWPGDYCTKGQWVVGFNVLMYGADSTDQRNTF